MNWKCIDCGSDVGVREKSSRADICDGCFVRRGDLIRAYKDGRVTPEQFAACQRPEIAFPPPTRRELIDLFVPPVPFDVSAAEVCGIPNLRKLMTPEAMREYADQRYESHLRRLRVEENKD